MKEKTFKFDGENISLEVSRYANNDRLAILAYAEDEPYADITINLPAYSVEEDEGFIDALAKDTGLEKKLIEEGIIKQVITSVNYNMGKYDCVVFDIEKLKEYDSVGVKEYLDSTAEEDEEEME